MMFFSTSADVLMWPTYSDLLFIELADLGHVQQFGEAGDGCERRAQFVGNMLQEAVLQLVGLLQRLVALLQRPLDIDRRGHVDDRQHGLALRQAHQRVVHHLAVGHVEPAR